MSSLQDITSEKDFKSHLSSLSPSSLLILFFYTRWAAPCKQMHTILATLAAGYPATMPPTVSFVSIDAEDLPDISEDYDITAVPFLVLIRDGKILEHIGGCDAIRVREAIEKHAGTASLGDSASSSIPPPLSAVPPPKSTTGAVPETTPAPPPLSAEQTKEALFARLAELVKAAPVMLFMKGTPSAPQCGFSRQIVGILRERNVKYGFFNILADEDVRQGLKEFAEWPTFPQLWVQGELVGGLDIVKEEINNDPDFLMDFAAKPSAVAA